MADGGPPATAADHAGTLHEIHQGCGRHRVRPRDPGAGTDRTGAHSDALPALEMAHAQRRHDETLLADVLRSEASVRGPAAALERYEVTGRTCANGSAPIRASSCNDPSVVLALDRPVRSGVRYDATTLVGRERDLERLTARWPVSRGLDRRPRRPGEDAPRARPARTAAVPVVHVVELVGVTSAEDIVGEVGSVLGVRDSVSGRVF